MSLRLDNSLEYHAGVEAPAILNQRFNEIEFLNTTSALRNDLARPIDRLLRADHQRAREIVFLADVFEQFHAGLHEQEKASGPRRGVGAGVVNRDLVFDRIRVGASETLDEMKLVGRGEAVAVEPEALVETDRVDDERIAFPMADRMPVIGRNKLLRVCLAIHEDRSERVRTADIENEDSFFDGILHEFYTVGRQELACSAGRLAARVRLELVFTAVSMKCFRPRLERHLTRIQLARESRRCRYRKLVGLTWRRIDQPFRTAGAGKPHTHFAW